MLTARKELGAWNGYLHAGAVVAPRRHVLRLRHGAACPPEPPGSPPSSSEQFLRQRARRRRPRRAPAHQGHHAGLGRDP
jgi:hypothetical protein